MRPSNRASGSNNPNPPAIPTRSTAREDGRPSQRGAAGAAAPRPRGNQRESDFGEDESRSARDQAGEGQNRGGRRTTEDTSAAPLSPHPPPGLSINSASASSDSRRRAAQLGQSGGDLSASKSSESIRILAQSESVGKHPGSSIKIANVLSSSFATADGYGDEAARGNNGPALVLKQKPSQQQLQDIPPSSSSATTTLSSLAITSSPPTTTQPVDTKTSRKKRGGGKEPQPAPVVVKLTSAEAMERPRAAPSGRTLFDPSTIVPSTSASALFHGGGAAAGGGGGAVGVHHRGESRREERGGGGGGRRDRETVRASTQHGEEYGRRREDRRGPAGGGGANPEGGQGGGGGVPATAAPDTFTRGSTAAPKQVWEPPSGATSKPSSSRDSKHLAAATTTTTSIESRMSEMSITHSRDRDREKSSSSSSTNTTTPIMLQAIIKPNRPPPPTPAPPTHPQRQRPPALIHLIDDHQKFTHDASLPRLLRDIPGAFVIGVLGKRGVGKSTLLNGFLDTPVFGRAKPLTHSGAGGGPPPLQGIVDMHVTVEGMIYLDTMGITCSRRHAATETMLVRFLMAVCHVLIVVGEAASLSGVDGNVVVPGAHAGVEEVWSLLRKCEGDKYVEEGGTGDPMGGGGGGGRRKGTRRRRGGRRRGGKGGGGGGGGLEGEDEDDDDEEEEDVDEDEEVAAEDGTDGLAPCKDDTNTRSPKPQVRTPKRGGRKDAGASADGEEDSSSKVHAAAATTAQGDQQPSSSGGAAGASTSASTADEPEIYFPDLVFVINKCEKHHFVVDNHWKLKTKILRAFRGSRMKVTGITKFTERYPQYKPLKEQLLEAENSAAHDSTTIANEDMVRETGQPIEPKKPSSRAPQPKFPSELNLWLFPASKESESCFVEKTFEEDGLGEFFKTHTWDTPDPLGLFARVAGNHEALMEFLEQELKDAPNRFENLMEQFCEDVWSTPRFLIPPPAGYRIQPWRLCDKKREEVEPFIVGDGSGSMIRELIRVRFSVSEREWFRMATGAWESLKMVAGLRK